MQIVFDQVSKEFGTQSIALSQVSFVIDPGELILITGPSGSGKTTIMRLLIHDYTPEKGEIYWGEQPLTKLRSNQVPEHRRQIGVIFQDYKLLSELNVWENVALPLSIIGKDQVETESRVTDLLKLVGLTDKAHLFPSQLSGGEAQRISIARALAIGPSVIFADEPTGNLDPESSLEIVRLLRQINRLGTTVILATHDAVVLEFLKTQRRLSLAKGILANDSEPRPMPKRDLESDTDSVSTKLQSTKTITETIKVAKKAPEKPLELEVSEEEIGDQPTKSTPKVSVPKKPTHQKGKKS